MDYDKTEIAANYDRARALAPETVRLWQDVLSVYVDGTATSLIVDFGCGTGRFSQLLAAHFGVGVIGIDPSQKMILCVRDASARDSGRRVGLAELCRKIGAQSRLLPGAIGRRGFRAGNGRITVPRRADRAERRRHGGNRLVRLQTARLSGPRTPMPNRLLRDYRDDDAAAVDRLAVAAFEQFRSHYSDWRAMEVAFGRMSALAVIGEIVVADQDNRIVGAVGYIPAGGPKAPFFDRSWPISGCWLSIPLLVAAAWVGP